MEGEIESTFVRYINPKTTKISRKNNGDQSLINMFKLMKDGQFCDTILIAGNDDTKISAQRLVLIASSKYFSDLILENQEEGNLEFTIPDVSGNILESLVEYCYTGSIELNEDNAKDIIVAASKLLFSDIVEDCEKYFIQQLTPDNCLDIMNFAEDNSFENMLEDAKNYARLTFEKIYSCENFVLLPLEKLEELLSDDKLNVSSEEIIFKAIMCWINHDTERKESLPQLLSLVRKNYLSENYLLDYATNISEEDPEIAEIIQNVAENEYEELSRRTGGDPDIILIVSQKTIHTYNPIKKTMSLVGEINIHFRSVINIGEKLYFLIEPGEEEGSRIQSLDLKDGNIFELPPMEIERRYCDLAALNGQLYAIGGVNKEYNKTFDTVEKYDSASNEWSTLANINKARYDSRSCELNGKLYILGGQNVQCLVYSLECYDPETNEWTICASLSVVCLGSTIAGVNDFLYCFGANDEKAPEFYYSIEQYDPGNDTWQMVSKINGEMSIFFPCLIGNVIYFIGTHFSTKYEVQKLDLETHDCELIDILELEDAERNFFSFASHLLL